MATTSSTREKDFTVTQPRLKSVLLMLENNEITIPEHQREFVWTKPRQVKLVESVFDQLPMPPIIIRDHGHGRFPSLEDGRQRLTTLSNFRKNLFPVNGRNFSEFSETEKARFDSYPIPVMKYSGLTDEDAILLFDKFQNGMPLSVGERLYSLLGLSPIIKLARELLLTPDKGFHNRAVPVWGTHNGIGKRGIELVTAVALVGGLAFTDHTNCFFTKKWEELQEIIHLPVNRAIEDKVKEHLDTILSIYEEVQKKQMFVKKSEFATQWDLGMTTGYIAYSLVGLSEEDQIDEDDLKDEWIDYLIGVRKKRMSFSGGPKMAIRKALEEDLHLDISQARSWNKDRFYWGYLRVFDPCSSNLPKSDASTTSSDSDDDDE